MSRYVVGIDLGTTNSALAYVDTKDADGDAPPAVRVLPAFAFPFVSPSASPSASVSPSASASS